MATVEEFLELYRTYEGLIRDKGKDYKTIEESADDLLSNRMRITRQMRNYLSHNADPAFLEISTQQMKMLEDLIWEERSNIDLVRDHLYTGKKGFCSEAMPIKTVLEQMVKLKVSKLPVLSGKTILGLVDIYKVSAAFLKAPDGILEKKTYGVYGKQFVCLAPEQPVSDAAGYLDTEKVICCTSDGTSKGPFIGLYNKQK